MVNLSTPSDQLLKELCYDYEKALYWLKKHFGGEKGYEDMRDRLLDKCQATHEPQTSEVVEYTSQNGNHWLCFEHARYYPDSHDSFCMPHAICYYETAASIGIFCLGHSSDPMKKKPSSCIIFTPHFFTRMAERLGIEPNGKEMVRRFLEYVPQMNIQQYEPNEKGEVHVDVRLPGSVGRGIRKKGDENVFEIRTFLTDKQLSNSERKITSKIRKWGDRMKFEPNAMIASRLSREANPLEAVEKEFKRMEKMGYNTDKARAEFFLDYSISGIFASMEVASPDDLEFWRRHGVNLAESVHFFQNRQEEGGKDFHFFKEYVALATEIAHKDGIRKFDKRKFVHLALTTVWNLSEEEAAKIEKGID